MKNKIIMILLAVFLVCTLTLTITACNQDCSVTGEHTWDEGEVTLQAECEKKGEKTFTCSVCGETKKEEIPATGHKPVAVGADVPADCENAGSTQGSKCSVCGKTLKEAGVIDALGHDFDETITENVTITATCTAAGKKTVKCSRCDETKETDVEALGHDFTGTETVTKQATCAEEGTKTVKCTRCEEVDTQSIPKAAHTYGNWTVTKEASCTEEGSKERVCSVCPEGTDGHKQTEVIGKTAHSLGDWVTTDDAKHWKECSVCHTHVDEADHSFTYVIGENNHTKTCVCGKEVTEDHAFTDALCACGEMQTDFPAAGYDTLKALDINDGDTTESRYFVLGKIKEIGTPGYNTTIQIEDKTGETFQIYGLRNFDGSIRYGNGESGTALITDVFAEGDVIVVYGVIKNYHGTYQVVNAAVQQHKSNSYATASACVLTFLEIREEATGTFDLPKAIGLTWTVKEGTGIAIEGNDAKVTRTAEDQTVVLTATVTINSVIETKDYTIKIPALTPGRNVITINSENLRLKGSYSDGTATVGGVGFEYLQMVDTGYGMQWRTNKNGDTALWNSAALPGRILSIEITLSESRSSAEAAEIFEIVYGETSDLGKDSTLLTFTGENAKKVVIELDATKNYTFVKFSHTKVGGALYFESIKITCRVCDHENLTEKAEKAADCTPGYAAHYECDVCGDWFSDAQGTTLINKVYTPAVHKFENADNHHARVEAKCETNGNVEYYVCDDCGHKFAADKTTELTDEQIVLTKLGHDWNDWAPGTGEDAGYHVRTCKNDETHVEKVVHSQAAEGWEVGATQHFHVCDVCKARFDEQDHVFNEGKCECGATEGTKYPVFFTVPEGITVTDTNGQVLLDSENKVLVDDNSSLEFKLTVTEGYTLVSVKFNGENIAITEGKYVTGNISAPQGDGKHRVVIEVTKDAPQSKFLTVIFKSNASDATSDISPNGFINFIESGADNVASVSNISKVYTGKNGLKFSSSSVGGKITITFKDVKNIVRVTLNACNWKETEIGKVAVNSLAAKELKTDLADYEFELTGDNNTSFTINATKRIYVKSITVEYYE